MVEVTVLMPVYNGARYIREAVDSILNQTFSDLELLIINDGSTDETKDILESYADSRLRLVHQENMGLTKSLNKGIAMSLGQYIARMDCDDISIQTRLEKQVRFMDQHPEVGVCGTWAKVIGAPYDHTLAHPVDPQIIRSFLIFDTPLVHPSVMIRKGVLDNMQYNPSFRLAQDFELWTRLSQHTLLANIDEALLLYRGDSAEDQKYREEQNMFGKQIRLAQLEKLGIVPTEDELNLHQCLSVRQFSKKLVFLNKAESWFLKLLKANKVKQSYPEEAFPRVLAARWLLAYSYAANGEITWSTLTNSPLYEFMGLDVRQKIKLYFKYLMSKVSN